MAIEFVTINEHGQEIDWIDPVITAEEFKTRWVVDNGWHQYRVMKKPGHTYVQRIRKESE